MNVLPQIMSTVPIGLDDHGKPYITSRQLADCFDKKHSHVLRDIRKSLDVLAAIAAECPDYFRDMPKSSLPQFCLTNYQNAQDKTQPMYRLNIAAVFMLVMRWGKRQPNRCKLTLIAAFNALEKRLRDLGELPIGAGGWA